MTGSLDRFADEPPPARHRLREVPEIQRREIQLADESVADEVIVVPPSAASEPAGGELMRDAEPRTASRRPARLAFRRVSIALALADAASIVAALLALQYVTTHWMGIRGALVLTLAVASLEWIVVFHAFGLYRVEHLSAWQEFRGIISATTVGVGVIMVTTFWWEASVSRSLLAWTWLFAITFELLTRRLFRWLIRRLKRDGVLTLRTLLVGMNEETARLARVLPAFGPRLRPDRMCDNVRDDGSRWIASADGTARRVGGHHPTRGRRVRVRCFVCGFTQ